MTSPTQLSLQKLRREGWTAQVVEHYSSFDRRRHDLWGFVDVLALKGAETLAVQTTSAANVSARVKKIVDSPNVGAVREAGWRIECHGWSQDKPGARWKVRVVDLS